MKNNFRNRKNKSYSVTTSGGLTVNISDDDNDGKPAIGDKITTVDGMPVDGISSFPDGSKIWSDHNGVITQVDPPKSEAEKQRFDAKVKNYLTEKEKKIKADMASGKVKVINKLERLVKTLDKQKAEADNLSERMKKRRQEIEKRKNKK